MTSTHLGATELQDIDMKGTIRRFTTALGLTGGKKIKKGPKKGKGYNHRDYRGTRGAIKDAEGN